MSTGTSELRRALGDIRPDEFVVLRNATVALSSAQSGARNFRADIGLTGGKIVLVGSAGATTGAHRELDLAGRMVWPRFADIHVHLDKGQVLGRTGPADGTLGGAIDLITQDRAQHWSADDLNRRMDFGLSSAFHYGSALVRTHIDSHPGQWQQSWEVFEDLRAAWAGRVALQGASLVPVTMLRDKPFAEELARRVARAGGCFGAVAFCVPDLGDLLDTAFDLAGRHGFDLDFHADENGDPASQAFAEITNAALRHAHDIRVVAGHVCSLSLQDADTRARTLDRAARASVGLISLPACNLYLQDRQGADISPRWRGLTAFKEARAAGLGEAIGSDNTRDPFHPFGDLDMLDTFRLGVRSLQLDDPVDRWVDTVTTGAAGLAGHALAALSPGDAADFIIFEGRSYSEVLARSEADRIVVLGGRALETSLPQYSALD